MSLVFAAIAPHGTLAVPGAPAASIPGAERTQAAMEDLGRRFDAAQPQATIVLTPHNVHVDGHFAVVVAANVAGSLEEWDAPAAQLTCPVDLELAALSIEALHDAGLPVVGVGFGANDPLAATAPLDWGTLIPLWVMGGRADPPIPVVLVSPCRDRPNDEHVRAGAALAGAAERSQLRVALIASADHGHAHAADGPYGYHPAAKEYDERIVELVREGRLDRLTELSDLAEPASADSLWQLLMLHGAVGPGATADLLSYEAPTYFGMLCATVERAA
jgi:aromatic ring-opening dioxygenase LigB subunit